MEIKSIKIHPAIAVVIGIGVGFLSSIAGQKHLNQIAVDNCAKQPDMHRLIAMRTWVGTAKYCMHTRYLAN